MNKYFPIKTETACQLKWNYSSIYLHEGSTNSSKIQQENVKFCRYERDGLIIDNTHTRHPDFAQMTNKFWDWMEVHYTDINRLQVLSGEPFYQAEFDRCMDFLYNHKNNNLDEIDRRRNLNWRTTFPWLVKELDNVV
jgi:hypothetical protein